MNPTNEKTSISLKTLSDGISVSLNVRPGSKKNSIEADESGIRVRISAPPVDGKANAALVKYLSDVLDMPKSAIQIQRGLSSKNKVLKITGISPEVFRKKIFL